MIYNIFIVLTIVSIVLSLNVVLDIIKQIVLDYRALRKAKEKYSVDPSDPGYLETTDFYSPTIFVGDVVKILLLYATPYVNLITLVVVFTIKAFSKYKEISTRGIIEW